MTLTRTFFFSFKYFHEIFWGMKMHCFQVINWQRSIYDYFASHSIKVIGICAHLLYACTQPHTRRHTHFSKRSEGAQVVFSSVSKKHISRIQNLEPNTSKNQTSRMCEKSNIRKHFAITAVTNTSNRDCDSNEITF